MLKSFRELEVWQKAHTLVLDIYRVTERFPDRERFGITAQLRRAAYSVPANLAEGFGRRTTKEFLQFIAISNGSLEETRYFILLSKDLKFLAHGEYERLEEKAISIAQMLSALTRSLRSRISSAGNPQSVGRGPRAANRGTRITSSASRVAPNRSRKVV